MLLFSDTGQMKVSRCPRCVWVSKYNYPLLKLAQEGYRTRQNNERTCLYFLPPVFFQIERRKRLSQPAQFGVVVVFGFFFFFLNDLSILTLLLCNHVSSLANHIFIGALAFLLSSVLTTLSVKGLQNDI